MIGHFNPSFIEDDIYGLMIDHEIGLDLYDFETTDVITEFFEKQHPKVEFNMICSPWGDETGGICSVAWCENGHPHLIVFEYKYQH